MVDQAKQLRVAVLGASGDVGRLVVGRALDKGLAVVCQTRDAKKLAAIADRARIREFDPTDQGQLGAFVTGADVVVFALGVDAVAATTLFTDVTKPLLAAMSRERVRRLIAITGVGAGETRGHGGFFYDRIIFPLFARQRYADKDRQETLIAASDLDWIIVRPAPFSNLRVSGDIEVHTSIAPDTVLRRITRDEVAAFVVDQFDSDRYLHQRPFIGHP